MLSMLNVKAIEKHSRNVKNVYLRVCVCGGGGGSDFIVFVHLINKKQALRLHNTIWASA